MFGKNTRRARNHAAATHLISRPGHMESYLCVAKSVHVAFVRLLRRLHASVCMRAPGWEPVPASGCLCAQPLKVVGVLREHLCPSARMWQEVLCRHGVFERQNV